MEIFQVKNSNALERTLFTGTVILGLVCAWVFRQTIISDGISYLDLGDADLRGDWSAAANAYWSPLYPYLLGAAMRILHPPAGGNSKLYQKIIQCIGHHVRELPDSSLPYYFFCRLLFKWC